MSYNSWYYPRKKVKKKTQRPTQRVKYGQTWWGEQWLNALSKIDFDNRLPRGRAYASNGSVLETTITGNKIKARVEGSMPKPYHIDISVPLFDEKQIAGLVDVIRKDPFILSNLLNRELPQELNRLALNQEIRLFPSSWKDFEMKCSCPDWAVPCKHLAAVIYVISKEIDANPFLVLKLHGLDLLEELKDIEGGIVTHIEEPITIVESMMVEDVPESDSGPDFSEASLPDFSKIPAGGNDILSLLPSSPLFYNKDFRGMLQSAYKNLADGIRKKPRTGLIARLSAPAEKLSLFDDTMILLNEDLSVDSVLFTVEGDDDQDFRLPFADLVSLLEALAPLQIAESNPVLRGIEVHRQFAETLSLNGSFMPQLMTNKAGQMLIRWIPAVNDPVLQSLATHVRSYANPGTIWLWSPVNKSNKYLPFNSVENSMEITSLFLGYYMDLYRKPGAVKETDGEKIPGMFFQQKPARFTELTEKNIPNIIQLWLKRLHLGKKTWGPLLHIDEKKNWFHIDFHVVNRDTPLEPPVPLQIFITKKAYASVRYDVLRDLTSLSDLFPDIAYYIQCKGKNSIRFNCNEFVDVFVRIIPILRILGIETSMPKALAKILSPKPSLRIKTGAAGKNPSFVNLDQLLGFEYQVAIGDTLMSVSEFRNLVGSLTGIVKIREQYVLISNDKLEKMFEQLDKPIKLTSHELLKSVLSEEFHGAKVELTPAVRKLISGMTSSADIKLPENLTATLRPYQIAGFRWMVRNSSIGFGSLIADDMGLGKTVQVIATLLKFKQDGKLKKEKALIIVPTTLLTNWEKEIEKFAPSLKALVYHGTARKLDIKNYDMLITTYGMVRTDLAKLKTMSWRLVVIDEAQNIKNSNTDQTKAVKSLKSDFRIAMSGTPVENRLSEYRSIMDFVNPGYLGSEKAFEEEFAKPIQLNHDQKKAALFRKITAPFILRRLKTDKTIISDLPDKFENNHYCALSREQAAIYQNVVNNALEEIEGLDGIERRGMVLKMITALKQICNHPDNFLKKGTADPAQSGKSLVLFDLLGQIQDAGEKTLIFTQYREMGDILVKMLEKQFGMAPLFLHGGTTRKQRDTLVEEFQNHRNKWIFILSLKAGGTGLNLTAASHVVHHDLWWNPAVEAQATDRAYRIGQTKNVMVNRLITRGTFEEKIDDMLKSKKSLANLTVSSGEKWIGELSNKELKEIFMLAGS